MTGAQKEVADRSLLLFARQMCVLKVRLLVLLAALVPGRVDAGLECDSSWGFLQDPSKCWAADIMRAFGGRGLWCGGDNVRRKGGAVAVQNVLRTCKDVQRAQCRRALEERGVRAQPGWPLPLTLFLSYYIPPSHTALVLIILTSRFPVL